MILNTEQILLFLELKEALNWKDVPSLDNLQNTLLELQLNSQSNSDDTISSFLEVLELFPFESIQKELKTFLKEFE